MQWLLPVIPARWEASVGGLLETTLGSIVRSCLQKINQVWGHVPVVPATQEAGAKDHLSLGVGISMETVFVAFKNKAKEK